MMIFATCRSGESPLIKGENPNLAAQLRRSNEKLRRREQNEKRQLARQLEREERRTAMRASIGVYARANSADPSTPGIVHDMVLATMELPADFIDDSGTRVSLASYLAKQDDPYQPLENESEGEFWERLSAMTEYDVANPSQTQSQELFPLSAAWRGTPSTIRRRSLANMVEPFAYHAPEWHDRIGGPVAFVGVNGGSPPSNDPCEMDYSNADLTGITGRGLIINQRQTTYPAIETYRAKQAILLHLDNSPPATTTPRAVIAKRLGCLVAVKCELTDVWVTCWREGRHDSPVRAFYDGKVETGWLQAVRTIH